MHMKPFYTIRTAMGKMHRRRGAVHRVLRGRDDLDTMKNN